MRLTKAELDATAPDFKVLVADDSPIYRKLVEHPRNSSLRSHSPGQRLAFSRSLPSCLQLLLDGLVGSTTHSRKGQAELSEKTVREVKTTAMHTYIKVHYGAPPFLHQPCAFCATILASDELTRLGHPSRSLQVPRHCRRERQIVEQPVVLHRKSSLETQFLS